MNSKAPYEEFRVDIEKGIEMFSNMSKCLDKKWTMYYDEQCDGKCDECEYMYGSGNSGQIENLFENVQEWLEELKELKNKQSFFNFDDVIKLEKEKSYKKAIDDCIKMIMKTNIDMPNDYTNEIVLIVKNEIIDRMNELKGV